MESPDMELYATEELDDGLGHGLRITRSDDAVYEARTAEDAVSRIYEEDGTWHAKVLLPLTDSEEAYDRMQAMMDDINDAYGTALHTNPKAFGDAINRDGRIKASDGATRVCYVDEEDTQPIEEIAETPSDASILKGWLAGTTASIGGGAGVGALAGGAIGMLGGPPGAVGGAVTGAHVGAGIGGVLSAWEGVDTVTEGPGYPIASPVTGRTIRYFERRAQTRYQPDAIAAAEDYFDRFNALHSLERELAERNRFDEARHARLEKLRDADIENIHDTVMEEHFHQFDEGEGLTATHETDTYLDAVRFVGHVANHVPPTDESSLYTSPDTFQQIFSHCTYQEDGETHYLDDAKILVHNVYDNTDTADAIVDWLEAEHPDLVQDVGRQHAMDA